MTNHFLRNFSLPGCFIAVLFFQENAIFAFCMSCVLYALIWFFYSKCIKKYFLFHKNNIFSISQKSLSGDFLQKTWFQKKMIQCFCFYFLIIFYVSHFRAHYFIQSDVAGKSFDVVLLVAPDLFADHGLADTYAFLWPVGSWLLSIAVYFFSLKKKLMSNGVAADIAKTMAESVTKYAIALTILIMFALKFFLN